MLQYEKNVLKLMKSNQSQLDCRCSLNHQNKKTEVKNDQIREEEKNMTGGVMHLALMMMI